MMHEQILFLSLAHTEFSMSHVTKLEKWIDELDDQLPPLTNFILPVNP